MSQPGRGIAIVAGKGGVGKTTTCINLASSFAERGLRCLAVDCDPQSNLTAGLGLDPYRQRLTLGDVVTLRAGAAETIVSTVYDSLDILPASPDLSSVESRLPTAGRREVLLRDALRRDGIPDRYAILLFDTPPWFGFHTASAMAAADFVLIPLQMSGFAFRGLKEVLRAATAVRDSVNADLRLLGAVPTFLTRTRFSREMVDVLAEVSPVRSFRSGITYTIKLQETSVACAPISRYAPGSRPAVEYGALATEVLARLAEVAARDAGEQPPAELQPASDAAANGTEATTDGSLEPALAGSSGEAGLAPRRDFDPRRLRVRRLLRRS